MTMGPPGPHHPDLENPRRYLDGAFYTSTSLEDTGGHGTMVAGIIAGNGVAGSGAADGQGFDYGDRNRSAIPDRAHQDLPLQHHRIRFLQLHHLVGDLDFDLEDGVRVQPHTGTGTDKALISNHSWNGSSGYTSTSALYDEMVVDASSSLSGAQSMTVVVSAGNGGALGGGTCSTAAILDSVRPPATAKNVITVGATESYRPVSMGQPPAGCGNWCSALAQDATNINRLAHFSAKGKFFERDHVGDPPLFAYPVCPQRADQA